ncbi:MAG: glycoside hydrolase family 5 protein [Clostridia bacterium]|nr:glycoside hydrolase family 5 protein [Clostridia bacterium]
MEKRNIVISAIVIFLIAIAFVISNIYNQNILYESVTKDVSWLKVDSSKIVTETGEPILLKGISSHGLEWYSDLLTENAFKYLRKEFDINTFRIAIYPNENLEEIKLKLYPVVDKLIELDLYVILDWHTLEEHDPNVFIEDSKNFFAEVSKKYSEVPNVLYEICNEPNSNPVTWNEYIKPYAEKIIPIIRENSLKSIVIVGTPDYCKKVNKAADNPLDYENIVYSAHFYAGSHGKVVKDNIEYALEKGIPVLVTEWGTTDATGDGKIYEDASKHWIEFLEEKNIGYINWSFCNKNEGSAILNEKYTNAKEQVIHKYLTESGKLVKEIYNKGE